MKPPPESRGGVLVGRETEGGDPLGEKKKRILSGVQPSGKLHIGNYFGAIRQHLRLMSEGHECFYFIATYHSLTSLSDAGQVAAYTDEVARGYLALGLDPDKACFFRQTDVPEVTELAWILSCVTPMPLLQRCVSYKDKVAQGIAPNHGLFAYPVLQAADILIYKPHFVPVGQDQKQHIEVTQDIQTKFNNTFEKVFHYPEPYILDEVAVVPGIDGRKMSKSYNNTINLFDSQKDVKKAIMAIVTDSTPLEDPKDPDKDNVMALMRLFADKAEIAEWEGRYRAGGTGYGHAKKRLLEQFDETFGTAREKYRDLENDPDYVNDVLAAGAKKARAVAQATMDEVRAATGLVTAASVRK